VKTRRRRRGPLAVLVASSLVLVGCSGEDAPEVTTVEVGSGEVIQTVAAVAELEPAARVSVTAPVGGEIARLLVEDGQTVAAGDAIAELSSESVELQIAQAESAAQAADALVGAAGASGLDLSPILGAFRGQLEATLPPVLDALAQQAAGIEDDDLREAALQRVRDARDSYTASRENLRQAEREAAGQAQQATAAQRAAAAAQRRQAELALEAARGRSADLTIVAPADGVIELGRADGGGAAAPDLGGLADQLGGAGGGVPDIGGLLGGGESGGGTSGPVAEGVSVSTGQTIATVYDLSAFTARVAVDEIDIVEVERDQAVTVLVDAFPEAEIRGTIANVAIAPTASPTGGATYPVTVRLTRVPDDVRLRVGLTASAEIEVRRVEAEATVPTAALLRRGGQEVVYVADDGVAREVPVTVLALGDDLAAVEGELARGDRVVTTGVETLTDGQELSG
jgi:multidrug efflux pump subunit AcrA (membrane-fusion protein)